MYGLAELEALAGADCKIRNHKARCVFHTEMTPSLTFFRDTKDGRGRYKCFGCGRTGDAVDWLEQVRGMSKKDALKQVAPEKLTEQPPPPPPAESEPAPPPKPKEPWMERPTKVPKKLGNAQPSKKAIEEKGRPPDITYEFYGPDYDGPVLQHRWNATDEDAKDLRWQYGAESRRLVYVAYPPGHYDEDTLIWCEGAKDARHVAQHGYAAIGIASSTPPWIHVIEWVHEEAQAKRWILWPDADDVGVKAMEILAQMAFHLGVEEVLWIDPMLDLKGGGAADDDAAGLHRRVESATPVAREALATDSKVTDDDWELGPRGDIKKDSRQNNIVMLAHLGWKLRWNLLADRPAIVERDKERYLTDRDLANFYSNSSSLYDFRPSPVRCWRWHLDSIAMTDSYHPVIEYLEGCPKPPNREKAIKIIRAFMMQAFAIDAKDDVSLDCMVKTVCAAVRRVKDPGCSWKYIPVIISARQSKRKSLAIRALCPQRKWRLDSFDFAEPRKDQAELLRGRWIVECAEMDGLGRAGIRKVKSFLDTTLDTHRKSYDIYAEDQARQCVFIGSGNETRFLRDMTGNVRFWPVHIMANRDCDHQFIERSRHKLWGAACVVEPEENLWPDREELQERLEERQESARNADPWEERVAGDTQFNEKTVYEMLGILGEAKSQANGNRLRGVLTKLGYSQERHRRPDGTRPHEWVRPKDADAERKEETPF